MKQASWLVYGAAALVAAACTNDFDKFGFGPPEGGSGGTEPIGGMGGTGSSVSSSSVTSGGNECMIASDCPGMDSACSQRQCVNGYCFEQYASIGTPCDEDGGVVCNNQGVCVECINPTHCPDSGICDLTIWSCAPPQCTDSMQNGAETDVDCGGTGCPPCMSGLMCMTDSDCEGGICDANNICQPCTGDTDCAPLPQTWCDAGVCQPLGANGTACTAGNECQTGFCIDGFCCDLACSGTCEACNISGSEGTCTPIAMGMDPDGECPATAQSTCGSTGMGCDGAGACVMWPNTTTCSQPSCTGGVATSTGLCDGMGTCTTTTTMCSPYVCGLNACLVDCSANGDADCVSTHYCASGACVPKLAQGQACTGNNQCANGTCADGFCCDSPCAGLCESCAAAHTGGTDGVCAPVTMGTDPASECGSNCCDGAGMCDTSGACP